MPETALIVGASRGLGLGLAREYTARGWHVIATERGTAGSGLTSLAATAPALRIETVDINRPDQVAALRQRLDGTRIDLLFVNAGIAHGPGETLPASSEQAFLDTMRTNAWSPLRLIEVFAPLVPPTGVIAAMSSGLGSVANNTSGGWELYRASKAALNTLLRSFAHRAGAGRTVIAMIPGWVRTEMGGANATYDVATSVRGIADTIAATRGKPGCHYIDHQGKTFPW